MGLIRNLFFRRSGRLGLVSDLVMVGAAAARLLGRRSGRANLGRSGSMRPGEMMLAGAAGLRLLQRFWRFRKTRRAGKGASAVVVAD